MYLLERLLAIFLGITVVPLRVLAYNFLYVMSALFAGIIFSLGLPVAHALILNDKGMSKSLNMLITPLIVFPLTATIITSTVAFLTIYLMFNAIIYTLDAFRFGFKNGLLYGMNGFWHALNEQQNINKNVINIFVRNSAEEVRNDNSMLRTHLIDEEFRGLVVVQMDLEVLDLQNKDPKVPPLLLSANELRKIEELIDKLRETKVPLQQLIDLNVSYSQYKDLFFKLKEVRSALITNDKTRIKDELIAHNEVDEPILLVKQYYIDGQWRPVPATSYVSDKDSFLHLLKKSTLHPLIKDRFKKPEPYKQMQTRYVWYGLTEYDCAFHVLNDTVLKIRFLMEELRSHLSELQGMTFMMRSTATPFNPS